MKRNRNQLFDYLLTHYGCQRWRTTLLTLSFHHNIINGYRIYIEAFHNLAKGKYFTSPADADRLLQQMVTDNLLHPLSFNPQPERLPAIGLIGYNPRHVENLNDKPVPGHYVDWDYQVLFHIQPALDHARSVEQELVG